MVNQEKLRSLDHVFNAGNLKVSVRMLNFILVLLLICLT